MRELFHIVFVTAPRNFLFERDQKLPEIGLTNHYDSPSSTANLTRTLTLIRSNTYSIMKLTGNRIW